MRGGCNTVLRWKFFVSQCQKKSCGYPSKFQKNSIIRKFFLLGLVGETGREYHVLQTKVFCLAAPKKIVVETLCVSETFGYRKSLWRRGGANTVLISKFFVWHCPNISQGIQSRKLRVSKNFTHEKGISLVSVVFVLPDSVQNFCRELFVFQKTSSIENFMDGREVESWSSVENLLSHSAEKIVEDHFNVSEIFHWQNFFIVKTDGGDSEKYQVPPLKYFCLTLPKTFVEETVCVSENFRE